MLRIHHLPFILETGSKLLQYQGIMNVAALGRCGHYEIHGNCVII